IRMQILQEQPRCSAPSQKRLAAFEHEAISRPSTRRVFEDAWTRSLFALRGSSREVALEALIGSAHHCLSLLSVSIQPLILGKTNCSHCLIFSRSACDLLLDRVTRIHQNLPEIDQRLPGCFGIGHPI